MRYAAIFAFGIVWVHRACGASSSAGAPSPGLEPLDEALLVRFGSPMSAASPGMALSESMCSESGSGPTDCDSPSSRYALIAHRISESELAQMQLDCRIEFRPNMDDSVPDLTLVGPVRIVSNEVVTTDSVLRVVESEDGRSFMAKYSNDCQTRLSGGAPDEQLTREFFHLSALNNTGITPNVYFLSPPATVTEPEAPKAQSAFFDERRGRCMAVGTTVRVMLEDRVGESVRTYLKWLRVSRPNDRSYLVAVLAMGVKTIALLEQMHGLGIVHGDIHSNNVMLKHPRDFPEQIDLVRDELVLIDLEYSVFFPPEMGQDEFKTTDPRLAFRLLSPWQLEGFRIGRRDDIFRVIEMMAALLSDGDLAAAVSRVYFAESEARARKGNDELSDNELLAAIHHECKLNCNLFRLDPLLARECCQAMGLSPDEQEMVQNSLETVLMSVRLLSHPDSEPDYASINAMIQQIIDRIHRF